MTGLLERLICLGGGFARALLLVEAEVAKLKLSLLAHRCGNGFENPPAQGCRSACLNSMRINQA